ncbi:sulfotransferase family protein [Glycomyces harbinensis]|uniref:Sulfotransferase family protein n=1 Tax=Glycomyces harbinensis TaxID=58114 RepID=A0A1G7AAT1_9ACTN|nr:sulfotransferase [Glycomyces harbinensis]SDE11909.1 Sulfotransferase family protein [Glycomyces harbinensis]
MGNNRTTSVFKVANAAMAPMLRSRKDPDKAWAKAVQRVEKDTGSAVDEGDREWIEDFRFLINCVADVRDLSAIGWVTTMMDAQARLRNRLRIRTLHREHPEIGAEPIVRPIFVVGLPRTATTLAHQVLARSKQCRGPRLWEMVRTDLQRSAAEEAQLVKKVAKQFSATRFAPDFDHIHPVDATKPEESMFVLPQGMYHLLFHAPMPEYRKWFAARDNTVDYQYLKSALQVLQYGRPRMTDGSPHRWVLKYPLDLGEMSSIQQVFPDATFVWTHRSPVTVMGSLCSLADLAQSLFVTRVDREALGAYAMELMAEIVESGRSFRQRHLSAVVDAPYHLLADDPYAYVPRLYQQLGLEWSVKDEGHLSQALERPIRDRKHEYTLGAYGLDDDMVHRTFSDYERMVSAQNFYSHHR